MLRITRIILRRSLDELSGSQYKNIGVLNSLNGRFVGLGEFDHFPRRFLYVPVSEVADDRSATNLLPTHNGCHLQTRRYFHPFLGAPCLRKRLKFMQALPH